MAHFNSLSLRDDEFSPAPAKGTARILLAGSSQLTGPGLAQNGTPVELFEKLLRQRFKPGKKFRKVEVINGGMEAYYPTRITILAKSLIAAYSPQFVITYFGGGDILFQNLMELEYSTLDGNNEPATVLPPHYPWGFSPGLKEIFGQNEALGKRLNGLAQAWAVARLGIRLRLMGEEKRKDFLLRRSLEQIQILRAAAERRGAKFMVAWRVANADADYSPLPDTDPGPVNLALKLFVPKVVVTPEDFRKGFAEFQLPFLEMNIPAGPEYYLPRDWHFSPLGAEAFARELANGLREQWPEVAR